MMAEGSGVAPDWPHFIVDAPSEADSLKAHGRVAQAITVLIQHRPEIKMIGLLGDWGSGKSTVVRLVEQSLSNSARPPRYFIYDTWLRQSDPPRRAFLEGLLAFLRKADIPAVNRELSTWRRKLDELDGRSETTVTAKKVELTEAGLHLLPLVVLVPLGLKLIGNGAWKTGASGWEMRLVILGWVLSLGPVLMCAYLKFVRRMKFADILTVLANRGGDTTHEVRSGSPDPTAIEFQERFEAIVTTLRGAGERLVVVVDNLDRLPPDEALTLWSTLRSFFLESGHGVGGIARREMPVIIVPLDPAAPGRIHGEKEGEAKGQLSRSFVEKTFDVVFHVPPPVLSSWQDYLRGRMRDVFGSAMPSDWPDTVSAIYEGQRRRGGSDLGVTPRSLNSFVNALAVLNMQWRDDEAMTIAAMAYFICRRNDIEKDIHKAFESDPAAISDYDPDWQASVATLYFGVPRERARELYLGQPIRSAIAAIDASTFTELARAPSFDRYFDQVLESTDPPSPLAVARVLAGAGLENAVWLPLAWRKLRDKTLAKVSAQQLQPGDHEAVAALVSSAPEPARTSWLTALANLWRFAGSEVLLADEGRPAAAFFEAMSRAASDAGIADFKIPLPDDLRIYITLLAAGGTGADLRALSVPQDHDTVLVQLVGMFQAPPQAAEATAAAICLAGLAPNADWSPVLTAMGECLTTFDPPRVALAFELMVGTLAEVPQMREYTGAIAADGTLQAGWSRLPPNLSDKALAAATALCLGLNLKVSPNDGSGWTLMLERRPDLARSIDTILRRAFPDLGLAWARSFADGSPEVAPLLQAIAAIWVLDFKPADLGDDLLADLPGYQRLLPHPSAHAFWAAATKLKDFWAILGGLDIDQATPMFSLLASLDGSKSELGKALKEQFDAVGAGAWDEAVLYGARPWPLIEAMGVLEHRTQTLAPVASARLRHVIPQILHDGSHEPRTRWFGVANWLSTEQRDQCVRELREAMAEIATTNLVGLLSIAGTDFVGVRAWEQNPLSGAKFVQQLIPEPNGIDWLEAHAERVSTWLRPLPTELTAGLAADIGAAIGQENFPRLRKMVAEILGQPR